MIISRCSQSTLMRYQLYTSSSDKEFSMFRKKISWRRCHVVLRSSYDMTFDTSQPRKCCHQNAQKIRKAVACALAVNYSKATEKMNFSNISRFLHLKEKFYAYFMWLDSFPSHAKHYNPDQDILAGNLL